MENDFIPTITLPTRIVDSSVSLIDQIFINSQVIKNDYDIVTGNSYCGITDHGPIFINISTQDKKLKFERPLIRIYGENNMTKFITMIASMSWDSFYKTNDPNGALSEFDKIPNHIQQSQMMLTIVPTR